MRINKKLLIITLSCLIFTGFLYFLSHHPKTIEIKTEKNTWKITEEPTFQLKGIKKGAKIKVSLITPKGTILPLKEGKDFEIKSSSPTKIKILKKGDKLVPGLYKIKIEIEENGKTETLEKEFPWGVLAINTNKSIYLPQEKAYLQIATLKEDGHTICDAFLELQIISPKSQKTIFSTKDGTIQKSGKCGPDNVTDVPDYFAYYQTKEPGIYKIKLKNLDTGYEIEDYFEVREFVPFDVERIGPTRIWPKAPYEMILRIKANQDFKGKIIETVPKHFLIIECQNCLPSQKIVQGFKELVFEIDLEKGKTYELKYKFDAPDISPYLYLLGPLKIRDFQETRFWQIASDATNDLILLWDGETIPTGWTCISCSEGDPYYQVYPRGAASYGTTTGGSATHTHTVSYVSCTEPSATAQYDDSGTNASYPSDTHIHNAIESQTVEPASNDPLYRSLKIIKYNGMPTTLPAGIIGIFATTSLPTGWSAYTLQDGYFLKGDGVVATGGSNTHTHNVAITTAPPDSTQYGNSGTKTGESPNHTHSGSGTSVESDHQPPYIEVVFAKATATTSIPKGLIALFDALPSSDWVVVSDVDQPFHGRFLKGNSSAFGATGGSETHTHPNLNITLSATTDTISTADTAPTRIGADVGHTHTFTVSFSTESHLPVYRDTIFAQYNPITISGTVYIDEGMSTSTDGWTVSLAIDGEWMASTTASTSSGAYSFYVPQIPTSSVITVYLDDSEGKGVTITRYSGSGDLTGLDIYQNRIIVRHEDSGPITISDLDYSDFERDSDILFTASSSAGTLTVSSTSEFYVWPGKTFGAWGENGVGGDISLADVDINGTFEATSTQIIYVSGGWDAGDGIFNSASSTVEFVGSGTKTITTGGNPFWNLTFNDSGGNWTFQDSATTTNNLQILAGTVLSGYDMRVFGGNVTGNGVLNWTGGTFLVVGSGNFGGDSDWSFYNLTFGNGLESGTTNKTGAGNITVSNVLTISAHQTLNASSQTWTLSGSGTPFVISGTFNAQNSTFKYTGTANTTITSATYYNLVLAPTGGSPTFDLEFGTFTINGNLTVGDGVNSVVVTANTSDPNLDINGHFTISQNATFVASDSGSFTVSGNWTNYGNFTHSSGTVIFDDNTKTTTFYGTTTFYNLTCTTPSKNLIFSAGTTQTIEGTLNLNGGSCDTMIVLRSTVPGSQWNINLVSGATATIDYVDVKDSNAVGMTIFASNSKDSRNNTNWTIDIGVCGVPEQPFHLKGGFRLKGGIRIKTLEQ